MKFTLKLALLGLLATGFAADAMDKKENDKNYDEMVKDLMKLVNVQQKQPNQLQVVQVNNFTLPLVQESNALQVIEPRMLQNLQQTIVEKNQIIGNLLYERSIDKKIVATPLALSFGFLMYKAGDLITPEIKTFNITIGALSALWFLKDIWLEKPSDHPEYQEITQAEQEINKAQNAGQLTYPLITMQINQNEPNLKQLEYAKNNDKEIDDLVNKALIDEDLR